MANNEQQKEAQFVVEGQHNAIRVELWDEEKGIKNTHPDAQWFETAGLGMFLHWGISTVSGEFDLSWAIITGWELAKRDLTDAQVADYNKRRSYSDNGVEITPNEYYKLAKDFKPDKCNPDEWIRLAKEAGFKYAVLTTRHHDGFALWPSEYGELSTKNHLNGRDFVGEYVAACRKYGIRVGLYYSPPDWYFNRDYMSYLIYTAKRRNPGLYDLDRDYNQFTMPSKEVIDAQNIKHAEYVKGQLEELLTKYGKIDLLWFDGSMPEGLRYPQQKIRDLQPGIVINHRLHAVGDFATKEVKEADKRPNGWWEFCTQWQEKGWAYMKNVNYRPLDKITAEYTRTIAWGGNYLLNIGPMSNGEFPPEALNELEKFTAWKNRNVEALTDILPISKEESSTAPAVAKKNLRYLYVSSEVKDKIIFKTDKQLAKAVYLEDLSDVPFEATNEGYIFDIPKAKAELAVCVVKLELAQ